MELLFVYRRKSDSWLLTSKILKLPDATVGTLAYELDEGRYLEIAQLFQGELVVSGETRGDYDALTEALFEFEDDRPRRLFEAQLKEFAATNPDPLALALFAYELTRELGIDIGDVVKWRPDEQPDLFKAAE